MPAQGKRTGRPVTLRAEIARCRDRLASEPIVAEWQPRATAAVPEADRADFEWESSATPDERDRDRSRARRRLREHASHPAAPESARAFARQELARMNAAGAARGARRRTPPPRPAARRAPAARRRRTASSSRTAGADPPAAEGDDDPPGRAARLTFRRFRRLTAGLSGAERLERFGALPPDAQDACWRHLARELEEARS